MNFFETTPEYDSLDLCFELAKARLKFLKRAKVKDLDHAQRLLDQMNFGYRNTDDALLQMKRDFNQMIRTSWNGVPYSSNPGGVIKFFQLVDSLSSEQFLTDHRFSGLEYDYKRCQEFKKRLQEYCQSDREKTFEAFKRWIEALPVPVDVRGFEPLFRCDCDSREFSMGGKSSKAVEKTPSSSPEITKQPDSDLTPVLPLPDKKRKRLMPRINPPSESPELPESPDAPPSAPGFDIS